MVEDGESRMVPGAPGTVCSLGEKAPGDGKKIVVPRRTHQIPLLSLLEKKKTEDINLIGLSGAARRKDLTVNWLSAHKTNARTCLARLARAALSAQCHIIEMCFIIAKRHALQLPHCFPHKG